MKVAVSDKVSVKGSFLKGLVARAGNSRNGIREVLKSEWAFRADLVVFAVGTLVACAIPGLSWCERAVMAYSIFTPVLAELANTAIEKTVDRISTEWHPLSGLAKDIGSALVGAAFFGAGICWFLILLGWALRTFR